MDDDLDDDLAAVLAAAKAEAIREARATVRSLAKLAQNPNAPAPARSSAGGFVLRTAGLFGREAEGATSKQPHEMTADELQRAIRELSDRSRAAAAGRLEPEPDIFE